MAYPRIQGVSVLWFVTWSSVCVWCYGLGNYTNWLFPLLVFLFFFKLLIDKNVVNFLGNGTPCRSHSDPIAVLQSKDWRGQTYLQPLLLRSEISLFWRTSCARDFFKIFFKPSFHQTTCIVELIFWIHISFEIFGSKYWKISTH